MAKTFYLTRDALSKEIILSKKKYKESNYPRTPAECFTPKLTQYLVLLVNKYANKGQWRGYSYIADMKSEAMVTLCQNCFKYDEVRFNNPFGYLTQIVKYSFITSLEKEEIIRDIKDSLWESIGMTPSYARQIKNEMLRDIGDTSNKGLKALKKDADLMAEKINVLGRIATRVNRLAEPDMEIDIEISETLEIEPLPYTGDRAASLALFDKPPTYTVEPGIEIAGTEVDCLSLRDDSTNSSTKRIIPDTSEMAVTLALSSIALTIRRDLMVKKLREVSGYNFSPRFPIASEPMSELPVEPETTEYLPAETVKRKRRKPV